MLNGIEGVIFDMDGTLVDSMWVWSKIDEDYIRDLNLNIDAKDLMKDVAHFSFNETAQYFKDTFSLAESVEEIKNNWNRRAELLYSTEVKLKKGALEFLKELKRRGIKTAIATSNSRHLLDICLKANEVTQYFDTMVTTDESLSHSKREPDVFLLAAERMGVEPDKVLVFEDVSHSMVGAKKAGMRVIGIKDRFSSSEEAEVLKLCELFLEDFTSLI